MPLEKIVHRVEAKFLDIGLTVFQAGEASEELEHLRAEFDRDDDRLATLRGRVALLAQRLVEHQELAALLPSQVESSVQRGKSAQAMRQALELDRVRREMAADREELTRLEHAVWCLEFRARRLERQMQRLREGR